MHLFNIVFNVRTFYCLGNIIELFHCSYLFIIN